MINFPVSCWLHDIPLIYLFTYCLTGILTLTWFMTALMTCLDCIVLVDCMSVLVYFLVYLLWTLWWISNLPCITKTARGWGRYYLSAPRSMGSFESQSISFEAGRVVKKATTRNHLVLTFINELWELARRISIFITWGIKEVHSIKKKGLG